MDYSDYQAFLETALIRALWLLHSTDEMSDKQRSEIFGALNEIDDSARRWRNSLPRACRP